MKLLIVSTMKPMIEGFIIEQYNAVRSWQHLRLKPEIVIFGDDFGVSDFCRRYKIRNIPSVKKNKKDVPLVSDIIEQAYTLCDDSTYVAYINADILLLDDFCDNLEAFDRAFPNVKSCLLTAIRFDTFKFRKLNFRKNEGKQWKSEVTNNFIGKPATADGIDLFVHKKGNYSNMPDFAVARLMFDTWMLDYAIKYFEVVVNLTDTVKIWHHLGDWYQNGKVVARDWNRLEKIMDLESVVENNILGGSVTYNLITHCPFSSYREGQIKFKCNIPGTVNELIQYIKEYYGEEVSKYLGLFEWIETLSHRAVGNLITEIKTKIKQRQANLV